jgi:hypothetical protein
MKATEKIIAATVSVSKNLESEVSGGLVLLERLEGREREGVVARAMWC